MNETNANGETVAVPKALLEKLLDRVDELEDELKEYQDHNERDKAQIRQQVTAAVEESERSDSSDTSEQTELSPMERLLKLGENSVTAEVTASVQRAKAMAKHFSQWASKAPTGYVVKENLKSLLQTATGERLHWRQVYRAAEALEKFTQGAIRFEKHQRHGWMLIGDGEIVQRLRGRSSSAPTG
jgi:hypothetical protein